jgi:hypothetical protein
MCIIISWNFHYNFSFTNKHFYVWKLNYTHVHHWNKAVVLARALYQ